jgi:DcmR-like sensory protein
MAEESRTVQLAGSTWHYPCHVCGFFNSREEEFRVLMPFLKEGFEDGDKVFQILAKEHCGERRRQVEDMGVDVGAAERSGQLDIRPWEEAHLRGGRFNQDAMLALLDEAMTGAKAQGFPLIRLWANMEWALEDLPGVHDIVEYESRFNDILPKHNGVVVCTYDLTRFSASIMMDVLRTHPLVIMGGVLLENPFYVPPDDLLSELRHRNAAAPAIGMPVR